MAHNRKLALSGIALTEARIPPRPNATAANRSRDELEQEMIQSGFLEGAPFKWVGLSIRYGLVDEAEPHYQEIDPKDGELPLAIEIDVHRLLGVSEDEMAVVYRKTALIALIHAGEKYHLKVNRMKELLAQA
ncbi:Imm39 family immunity protein [Hyphomonas adhaerens]|nr:Imm39 family immunity protein [Hyphomonas adhaerens]